MKCSHIATPRPSMEEKLPTKILKPTNAKKISISMFVVSLPLLYVSLLHVPPSDLFNDTTFWFLISNSIIVILAADSGLFFSSHDPTNDLYDEYVRRSRARAPNAVTMPRPEVVNQEECPEVIKHVQTSSTESSNELRHEQNTTSDRVVDEIPNESRRHVRNLVVDRDVSDCSVTVREKEISNEATEEQNITLTSNPLATADEINIASKDSTKISRSRSEKAAKNRDATRRKSFRRSTTERRSCRVEESEYWRMSDEELNRKVEDFIRKFNREIRLQAIMT
ncbi:Uncharacterized protein M6B38_238890 [Iris pallida]|uniref:Uncharacterized protein n=1 Tax=Iris pallida TaxID=29817 RepID=A0AAX6DMG2_IRIPA|nr:Uncharacterized protein M6B38_238890 [Iris pallida]